MEKYLITGGAGFIGSHIAEHLSMEGHSVTVLDSLRTGNPKNIEGLKVNFVQGDIRDKELVLDLISGCDTVFHLAALVSVPESLLKLTECIDINTIGTINVLNAAQKNGNCKVVLSSTAANYGDNPILPKTESLLAEPKTPYAITKLDGEYFLNMFNEQYNVPTVSLRYFNVFGPRQNPRSAYAAAVPIFIEKALKNEPLTIYGDGLQTRDFIYVKDVVNANVLASTRGQGTYNVALGQSTTILELAERIIEITNSSSKIEFFEERPGDIRHSRANPEKFNALGFEPRYTVEAALREPIAFYQGELLMKN